MTAMTSPSAIRPFAVAAAAVLAAVLLASCKFHIGGGGGASGTLTQDLGKELGDYLVVDLSSGALQSFVSLPDLATNQAYRTTSMVFKAVPAGSCVIGQAANTFGAQVDEVQQTVTFERFYIGVFEVTQGQWTLIAGASATPWTSALAQSVAGAGSIGAAKPAFALSRDAVAAGLATVQSRIPFPAAIPSGAQWEYACRAGSTTVFSWGDLGATPITTAGNYALVNETAQGQVGPNVVGSLAPNAFGLYDMLGNVAEWTSDGNGYIRGGSWRDSLAQARSANKMALDHTTAHVLAGVRLILAP
jgi:formylglycine-generating enzyme required for sulfatase activity